MVSCRLHTPRGPRNAPRIPGRVARLKVDSSRHMSETQKAQLGVNIAFEKESIEAIERMRSGKLNEETDIRGVAPAPQGSTDSVSQKGSTDIARAPIARQRIAKQVLQRASHLGKGCKGL